MRVNYGFAYANKEQFLKDKKKIVTGFAKEGLFVMGVTMAIPNHFTRGVKEAETTSKQKIDMLLHLYYYEDEENQRPSTN